MSNRFCSRCGAQLDPTTGRCPYCHSFSAAQESPVSGNNYYDDPRQGNTNYNGQEQYNYASYQYNYTHPENAVPIAQRPKKRTAIPVVIALAAVVIIALAGGAVFGMTHGWFGGTAENQPTTSEEALQQESDESATAQSAIEEAPVDIAKVINDAGMFAWSWFYGNTYTDKTQTIEEEMDGGWKLVYELVSDPNVNSVADLKRLTRQHYSEDVTANLMDYKSWLERDGRLYMSEVDGIGDFFFDNMDVVVTKVSEEEYQLLTFEYADGALLTEPEEITMTKENGYWVLDRHFAFSQKMPITIVDETSNKYTKYLQYDCYRAALTETGIDFYSSDTSVIVQEPYYFLYDMDNDGVKELVIHSTKSMAECRFDIYTADNGAQHIYNYVDTRLFLEIPNDGNGLLLSGSYPPGDMDYVMIDRLVKNGNQVEQTNLVSKEVPYGDKQKVTAEYFGNAPSVQEYPVYDYSGLYDLD